MECNSSTRHIYHSTRVHFTPLTLHRLISPVQSQILQRGRIHHTIFSATLRTLSFPRLKLSFMRFFILPRIQRRQLEESAILVTRDPSGLNPLRRSTSYYFTVTGENGRRRSNLGGDEPEKAVVERKREQQKKRKTKKSNSSENILRTSSSGELQLAKALRQQRSSESSLRRSWLVRRRRRNHLSQGKSNLIKLFIDLNEMVRLTFYLRYIIVSYRSR